MNGENVIYGNFELLSFEKNISLKLVRTMDSFRDITCLLNVALKHISLKRSTVPCTPPISENILIFTLILSTTSKNVDLVETRN